MAKRLEYQIVGRYMNGAEVTAYHMQSLEGNKSGRYTREQVCYLVGRGQVTNCDGQIYQDKVLLRGVGMQLDSLPIKREDTGELKNTESIGRVKSGTDANSAMTQLMIVGVIAQGKSIVGYKVSNAGGAVKKLNRQELLALVSEGKIGNAKVQNDRGKVLLRGVGCNLNELPVERLDVPEKSQVENKENGLKGKLKAKVVAITSDTYGILQYDIDLRVASEDIKNELKKFLTYGVLDNPCEVKNINGINVETHLVLIDTSRIKAFIDMINSFKCKLLIEKDFEFINGATGNSYEPTKETKMKVINKLKELGAVESISREVNADHEINNKDKKLEINSVSKVDKQPAVPKKASNKSDIKIDLSAIFLDIEKTKMDWVSADFIRTYELFAYTTSNFNKNNFKSLEKIAKNGVNFIETETINGIQYEKYSISVSTYSIGDFIDYVKHFNTEVTASNKIDFVGTNGDIEFSKDCKLTLVKHLRDLGFKLSKAA